MKHLKTIAKEKRPEKAYFWLEYPYVGGAGKKG